MSHKSMKLKRKNDGYPLRKNDGYSFSKNDGYLFSTNEGCPFKRNSELLCVCYPSARDEGALWQITREVLNIGPFTRTYIRQNDRDEAKVP